MKYAFIVNKLPYILVVCVFISLTRTIHAQQLRPKQRLFLQTHTKPIFTDEILSNGDWEPISPQIKNKRIVLIGEPNHGSRQIFQLRNDLVKHLHKKMGFDIVLFESGIGELISADLDRKEISPLQMTYGLFGGWRTKEFVDLMTYIQSAGVPISGFDVQRSGNSFRHVLAEMGTTYKIDSFFYHDLEARYGSLQNQLNNKKTILDSVEPNTMKLIGDYRKLYDLLAAKKLSASLGKVSVALRTIINRINFLEYMLQFVKDQDWKKRWAARDRAMAENIVWLCDSVYKGKKIIVIAHNFHIAKSNEKEKVMGEMLHAARSKEMYSIGVFAGSGEYADNFGQNKSMLPADSVQLDIKHIIASLNGFVNYLDMPAKTMKGSEWLDHHIIVNDTFIDLDGSNKLILSAQFDGLLLVKKISPPEKQ